MKYKAAPGAPFPKDKAQEIGEWIETLGESVTTEEIRDAALADRKSPLHGLIERDPRKALDLLQKVQVRTVVNHIMVEVRIGEQVEVTKAFHSIEIPDQDDNRRYVRFDVIKRDADARSQPVLAAYRELKGWQRRWKQYASVFGAVMDAIDGIDMGDLEWRQEGQQRRSGPRRSAKRSGQKSRTSRSRARSTSSSRSSSSKK